MRTLVLVGLLCASGFVAAADCLKYQPNVVSLTGKVERREFPGLPPTYESQYGNRSAQAFWFLKLDHGICTVAGTDPRDLPENNQQYVQIVVSKSYLDNCRDAVGADVTVSGTLYHAINDYHHEPLVMIVSTLKLRPNPAMHRTCAKSRAGR